MRAGRRDRKITIQQVSTVQDTIGYPAETWTTLRDVWAEVIPIRGAEALRFERQSTEEINKFVIPYFSDITQKHRISYNSQTWDILYISEINRREGLEIIAQRLL